MEMESLFHFNNVDHDKTKKHTTSENLDPTPVILVV